MMRPPGGKSPGRLFLDIDQRDFIAFAIDADGIIERYFAADPLEAAQVHQDFHVAVKSYSASKSPGHRP
jgi:hypothetical protein